MNFSNIDQRGFECGFMFALHVISNLTGKIAPAVMTAYLRELVSGAATLSPSPLDAISSIENEYGRPLPESLKQSVHRMLSNRSESDEFNRAAAKAVLRIMGED